jgi:hypothetical protein
MIAPTPSFVRTGPEAVAHQQAGLSALDRPDLLPAQSITLVLPVCRLMM